MSEIKISARDRYQILRACKANLDVKFNPSEQNRAPTSTANLRAEKPKNNAKFASQSIKFNKIRMNLASNLASKGVKFNAKF
ncbi:hypothetical protein [Campylobacter rectus]|uniref:hypothetical protein n=1 Tax=Campylobacter rectus TaxID=203 RepID=UPI0028DAF70D|nr:hypothetical protein [Campylobacter rectus]